MKGFVVSLHDVAPSKAELCRRWVDVLTDRNIKATLLVVPGHWNGVSLQQAPHFISWLHEVKEQGHEIALHGLHHTKDAGFTTTPVRSMIGSLMARGCEEFWHLPYTEAATRLQMGLDILHEVGFSPSGFVAPGWLMSDDTRVALKQLGLKYTTTHTHVLDIQNDIQHKMLALSQRPQSVLTRAGIALNVSVVKLAQTLRAPLRIAIHPNDSINPRVRKANIDMLDSLMGVGYTHMTYEDFVTKAMPHFSASEADVPIDHPKL